MLMPLQLLSPEQLRAREDRTRYTYGLVYGFLLALLLYNLLLYLGLRQAQHRDYSIYLAVFLLMNLAYTGHGYNWLWPDAPALQAYAILISMVLFAATGLRFAGTFLNLAAHAPRLTRGLCGFSLAALGLMAVMVGLDRQTQAALLAFTVVLVAFAVMLALGGIALWRGYTAARYFLLAVISGSVGTIITTLTVWGWIPYSAAGFRAVEFGLLIEATLLALAVAYRVREHDRARERAEQLARVDPLTGLLNRRALLEQGEGLYQLSRRTGGELALVLLDLDHFKRINDRHGHGVGDQALVAVARILQHVSRRGDLAARWGGEEFVLLLPGAGLDEARTVAERIRLELAHQPVRERGPAIELRASFGIAVREEHENLTELIREADEWLYQAKREGRDRVRSAASAPWPGEPDQA
jgi:diguanylate cyclase (GGDEF)-like protein